MTAAIYENPRARQSEIAATNLVFLRRTEHRAVDRENPD
jgi:hypothetical protein